MRRTAIDHAQTLAAARPLLSAIAARLGRGVIDPDDLLSEGITRALARWSSGIDETDDPTAYVITVMRHRVIDELRSPRRGTVAIDDVPESVLSVAVEPDRREDFALIRRAFATLTEDQRRALTAVVVDGRRPRELVGELDRRAGAISTLVRRARDRLRERTVEAILERCPNGCARRPVRGYGSSDARIEARLRHACESCRQTWSDLAVDYGRLERSA